MSFVNVLKEIKQVDTKIITLRQQRKKIPAKLQSPVYKLDKSKNEFKDIQNRYNKLLEHYAGTQEQKDSIEKKLKKIQEKLREVSGADYQKLLRDQSKLKKSISFGDRREETTKSRLEELKTQLDTAKLEYDKVSEEYDDIFTSVKDELGKIDDNLELLINKVKKLLAKLDTKTKNLYINAHKMGKGQALASLTKNRCSACNITLPPNLILNILKQEELYRCPNCGRVILLTDEEPKKEEKIESAKIEQKENDVKLVEETKTEESTEIKQ